MANFKKLMMAAAGGAGQGDAYYNRLDDVTNPEYNQSNGMAISDDGYVAHVYQGVQGSYPYNKAVVQCFDPQGNLTFWKYDGYSSRYDSTRPYDVAIDDEHVYVVWGYYEYPRSSPADRAHMVCFDRDTGAVQWNTLIGDLRINSGAVGYSLSNGAAGELVMAGKRINGSSISNFIARIDKSDGSIVDSKHITGVSGSESGGIKYLDGDIFFCLGNAAVSVNNALTTINASGEFGSSRGFDVGPTLVAHVSGNKLLVSNHSFTRQWGKSMSGVSNPSDVFVDDDDNVYLVFKDGSEFTKFDSSGNVVWSRKLSGSFGTANSQAVGNRINGDFFTAYRPNSYRYFETTGVFKLNRDGTGTGTYGDTTYSSTSQSYSDNTDPYGSLSLTLSNDIGSATSISVTWNNHPNTYTETVYTIS